MPSSAEIAHNVRGALRLAARDSGGMAYFDTTIDGFWRSFSAALVIGPAYLILLATQYGQHSAELAAGRFFTVEIIAYVMGWFLFPVVMLTVTRWIGREARFVPLIVAVNWSNVVQIMLITLIAVIGVSGVLPDAVASILHLVAVIWILTYRWFIVLTALDVPGGVAAAVVFLDLLLGLAVTVVAGSMHR